MDEFRSSSMDEKYQRIKVLGKGSFGKAYLVKNTEANALCVVKQMETSMMDPKERNEAVKEAMLLKRMDHPNIVRFQEVFMTRKGRLCIVMDYADGGDVHMEIKRREGVLIEESKIMEWFVQTCFAMKHVHERKVLHRDLKTQNIFLMATGQIKLGDFGIARVLDATKDYAKTMVGTPYYLSPEIIEDRPYNFKSDIWSCGVVLYEMTTLKHPFDADSLVILASKILKDQYPPPDGMYSAELRELIRLMLSKDANMRPGIADILCFPFLQAPSINANSNYGLGIDLSEFTPAPEAARPSLAERRRQEVAAAYAGTEDALAASSAGPLPPPAVPAPAAAPGRTATASADPEDSVLIGTLPPSRRVEAEESPSRRSDAEAEKDEEYEEEFEDYSGSEDGREANDLRESVAKLKLDGAGKSGTEGPTNASDGDNRPPSALDLDPARVAATGAGSRIAAKAESLRTYLTGQMEDEAFTKVYRLVRSSGEVSTEVLQEQVNLVIGTAKANELFTLFQLLCFLEDVAANNAATAEAT